MPKFVDHESRRAHVTEIAAELVAAEGRSALTARRVAEATGHSTTIVSHYFDDMAELMYETYRLAVRRSRSRVAAVLDADPTDIVGLAEPSCRSTPYARPTGASGLRSSARRSAPRTRRRAAGASP
ncbi:MAG: TetR family transcriptional regulator [Acidimicrobiales bacterium]